MIEIQQGTMGWGCSFEENRLPTELDIIVADLESLAYSTTDIVEVVKYHG